MLDTQSVPVPIRRLDISYQLGWYLQTEDTIERLRCTGEGTRFPIVEGEARATKALGDFSSVFFVAPEPSIDDYDSDDPIWGEPTPDEVSDPVPFPEAPAPDFSQVHVHREVSIATDQRHDWEPQSSSTVDPEQLSPPFQDNESENPSLFAISDILSDAIQGQSHLETGNNQTAITKTSTRASTTPITTSPNQTATDTTSSSKNTSLSSENKPDAKHILPRDDPDNPKSHPRPQVAKPAVSKQKPLRWMCAFYAAFGSKLLGDKKYKSRYKSCIASQFWSSDNYKTHLKRVHYIEDHQDDHFTRCPTQWDECHKAFARPAGPGNKPRKGTEEWKKAQISIYQKVWGVLFPVDYFLTLEPPSMPFDCTELPPRSLENQVKTLFSALQHVDANKAVDALAHRPTDNMQQNLKHAFATMSNSSQPDEVACLRTIEESTISAATQDLPPSVTVPESQEIVPSLGPSQHQWVEHSRTPGETPIHDLSWWPLDKLECDPPTGVSIPEPQEPVKLECRAFEAIGFLQSLPEHEAYRANHHLTVQETPVANTPPSGPSTALEPHELGIYMKGTASDARFFARVLPTHQNYRPGCLVVITMTPPPQPGLLTSAVDCGRADSGLGIEGNSFAVPDCPSMNPPLKKHDQSSFWSDDNFNLYGDLDGILNPSWHPDVTGEESWLLDSPVKPLS